MANAKKCDRCGVCYDPLSGDAEMMRFQNPIFQTPDDIRHTKRGHFLLTEGGADIYVDLCPACTRDFVKFMNCDLFPVYNTTPESQNNKNIDIKDCSNDCFGKEVELVYEGLLNTKETRPVFRFHFKNRKQAISVLNDLRELIDEYGDCSVQDYYDLAGRVLNVPIKGAYTDAYFGWWNLDNAAVETDGKLPKTFVISFPEAKCLGIDRLSLPPDLGGDTDGD